MIRRARRDGREARGNEEREKREDSERDQRGIEKREPCNEAIVSSIPQGMTSSSKFGFYKIIECIIKKICHGVKQNAKICARNGM